MRGPLDRTKVVLRHLPPSITQSALMEQLDSRFGGRYNWACFRSGKSSTKHPTYSRAYINFNRPEDVIEFAEFFDGHVFVNEKGTQFKAIVEYAPSQRVPKQWSKKDGREGTIVKDPEYLQFLEFLAKPVENLPSAEIQLERKEAERSGASKDTLIVTPLMDYVRQKRAAKTGARRSVSNGKPTRRVVGSSTGSPNSGSSKRGSEKKRTSTMYVLRDSTKGRSGRDKSTYVVVSKRDDQQVSDKSVLLPPASGTDRLGDESGGSGLGDAGKKKILLVKGKEKEILNVADGPTLQQNVASVRNSPSSTGLKQNQRREASGKMIRNILLNKDNRHNQSSSAVQSDHQVQIDKDRRLRRPPSGQAFQKDANGPSEDKVVGNDAHAGQIEKQEKRTRNRDRPDRGVWAPLRRSDGSHASDESLSSSSSQPNQVLDSAEGATGEMRNDMPSGRAVEFRPIGSGRTSHSSVDNGSFKHGARRGSAHNIKEAEGAEGKPSKRGGSSGYGSHEKQVWVQKSSPGS